MKKLYELTPEHRAQFEPWGNKWIANALNCAPMDEAEREAMRVAVNGLYDAAGLPRPKHIVFVPSPFVLAFAGGFGAAIWHLSRNPTCLGRDATRAATEDATRAATAAETMHAALVRFLLLCAANHYNMWNGGNQWSGYPAFLSFFRYVAKLDLDYSKWEHYEAAAIHGGPRIMHPDFCMVSERPEFIHRDDRNRPHCEDGPFCRWRDGFALWYWHGVRVPREIILSPERITVEQIKAEKNAEIRRIMRERFGEGRYLTATGATIVDIDTRQVSSVDPRGVPRALLQDEDGDRFLVGTDHSTKRVYYMQAPRDVATCRTAHEALCGFDEGKIVSQS